MDCFPHYDRTSLQNGYWPQKGFLYAWLQFASRQNYSGSSSGFPISVRALLPVTLVIVGCKRAPVHRNLFVIRPQTIALCIRIRQNSGLQHLIRIANPVHDMCGRECRLLNILKIIMGFWFILKLPHRLTDNLRRPNLVTSNGFM
jgi:hypothetical protein